jgi:hypothetical protein
MVITITTVTSSQSTSQRTTQKQVLILILYLLFEILSLCHVRSYVEVDIEDTYLTHRSQKTSESIVLETIFLVLCSVCEDMKFVQERIITFDRRQSTGQRIKPVSFHI